MQKLDPYPRINPALFTAFSDGADKLSNVQAAGLPWYALLFAIILLYLAFSFLYKIYWLLETPGNIRYRLTNFVLNYNIYGNQRSSRKGLSQYISELRQQGLNDNQLALTNFYTCSAISPATFTPVRDGIVSPDAIRLVLAAGVRYLDIQIYGGGAETNYAPFVAAMEPGSNWRRITMNQLPLSMVIDSIVQYGMTGPNSVADISEAAYSHDPMFIMLRFNGKIKPTTFTQTATILSKTIEQFRLDFTYNGARGMENLFKIPITQFMDKIVVLSNVYPPLNNRLNDYINIGPRGTTPLDLSPKEILGIPDNNRGSTVAKIQQHLTVSIGPMDEPECNSNGWNWRKAHELGVHFAGLNFWSTDANLTEYRKPNVFGVNSFLLKPAHLRYTIEYDAPPLLPSPELDARDGKPKAPPGIIAPM